MTTTYQPEAIAELYARYRDYDLVVDTRRVTPHRRALFFALPGTRAHGRDYIAEAYRRGVRDFVVAAEDIEVARPQVQSEVTWVVGPAPLEVLQALAAHHRRQFSIDVVAITGSNGKTTVKDWLTQLLGIRYKVCVSPRSYNSQIGVPLSVWQLRADHQLAIFEAGISRPEEMEKLAQIIQPTHGIFTTLGAAHDEGFPTRADKFREKLRLFQHVRGLFVGTYSHEMVDQLKALPTDVYDKVFHGLQLPPLSLPTGYLPNVRVTVMAAQFFGIPDEDILAALPTLRPLPNRLEQTAGRHGAPVINDSYSNDLEALSLAIDVARDQSPSGRIHLVLGDIPALLSTNSPGTGDLAPYLFQSDFVEEVITVGQPTKLLPNAQHYPTVEALLASLPNHRFSPLPILVKGASYQHLNRVAAALSLKQHRTNLRIDLEAIRHNFSVYRSLTDAKIIVMVKASAYGGGSLPIARAVAGAGADYLAVAYTDEGKELRRGGVTLPIMVLNPEPEEFAELATYTLEPVVGSRKSYELARKHQLGVHVEIDTGMARLGFDTQEVALLAALETHPRVLSIFSHLVASEDPEQRAFTNEQYQKLTTAADQLTARLPTRPWLHLLNSNGITHYPEYALDAVRLGIGLYGIGDAALKDQLRPALQLTSRVAAIKEHPKGTTIGYNRRGILNRPSRVATISIGYADGLPRRAGLGRFSVWIKGGLAPTVGSVCMDMTMVDVTDLPDVRVGEEVEIFGPNHSIAELARAVGTIGYEILTGVGPRVHRIYLRE